MSPEIPVVLFAYSRTDHLVQVLDCLRREAVPRLLIYSDGAKGPEDRAGVDEVRKILREIDWCAVELVEREKNWGLGRNVMDGVSRTASRFDAFIVCEDDLICVPGTYRWVCGALIHYRNEPRVMSVTAWTHPRVTPAELGGDPYLDARAECWVWGTWSRSWIGMEAETALEKLRRLSQRGIAADTYGIDLPPMAANEEKQNIWAVRWLYHHLENDGLCLRPPWSMVEHIGFDQTATNAAHASAWANPSLRPVPKIPDLWPVPAENPSCRLLWQHATAAGWRGLLRRARAKLGLR